METTKKRKTLRKKLKYKIMTEYETIKEFSKKIGYTPMAVYGIVRGDQDGSFKFWNDTQKLLGIPDEEMWSYQKREGEKSNE